MISSPDNEKLKLVRKLQDRRWRDKLGLFVCEGEDQVAAATADPVELLIAGENVEAELLAQVATSGHPPRVIGVYRRADLPSLADRRATVALWQLADPGNVGTLIRTADAFGAAVALSPGCADPTSPKAVRASAGSIWNVPTLSWDDLPTATPRVALVAHGGVPLSEANLAGPVILLLGAEREGLPREIDRDLDVTIPIGSAESLNVAAAGAIALYEWQRQNGPQ